MPETINHATILEELRSISERADMNQYLKTSLGGYTKSSVQEYLDILRKQQQAMADTFTKNQQNLFEEKERLKKNNDSLRMRLNQIETEYRNLTEAMRIHDLEEKDYSVSDVTTLKGNIAALEETLNSSKLEKSQLEQKIRQQSSEIEDYTTKLEQAAQEKRSMKETLKAELLESKNLRASITQLSNTVEERDHEIEFLKAKVSEGQLSILSAKVSDLTQQLQTQTKVMVTREKESKAKAQTIETLKAENSTLKQSFTTLTNELQEQKKQNERVMSANQTLTDQLEEEYKRSIELIKDKSYATSEKIAAIRDMEAANAQISLLQLQLKDESADRDADALRKRASDVETAKQDPPKES